MSYARLETPLSIRPPDSRSFPMKNFFLNASGAVRRPAVTPARRKRLLFSYAPDWAITIVLAAIFFSLDSVEGYRRVFSVQDTSLRHPYAIHERIPNVALYFICFVAPVLIQPVINFLTIRSWWDLHNSTLGLILGLAITGAITQFVKITVGRPRPDIIDRCQPPASTVDPEFGLSNWTICTQTDSGILRDGFRSFPSGHSSMSFAGLGFLAYYLAGKLHLFDNRGHAGKAWISVSPFFAAALVAISRTMDYRHHWQDVLVGSILGTLVSYFAYRQYYPSLSSELSHRPYSPRIKREDDDVLPVHASPSDARPPQPHPFAQADHDRYGNGDREGYELNGTVLRPNPGPLEEVWHEGESQLARPRENSLEGRQYGESRYDADSRSTSPAGLLPPHAVRSPPQHTGSV
ncbi:phosphatidic acid phosphatase type 2/haloperoxidase [Cyathus striatus]|nr:phosphatidic acid phosphatase type 2/haloperoxidase [Cyathus striatus]